MAERKRKDDTSKLSFEESIEQLKEIVEQIEQGEIPLAESLDKYERGMSLIGHCRGILQRAEARIEKISKEPEAGSTSPEPDASEDSDEDEAGLF